ncbi:hypothetical protein [Rhodovulum visakhapatnamense]|uniref:Uncharacterized protein n=1 Tax=Rhodovulum visakhapatnamense TaxID=364297 RepID=A0ABS1RK17_9RHOB|nr:hypothetical protein [Rhodovulum visakhapatnamense]MBL3571677.1 hypothetical protein [Rhodovulum visakhapatnamense]MBL3580007.1 hypothetical protein [Rhodovulum visakhapatnamense]
MVTGSARSVISTGLSRYSKTRAKRADARAQNDLKRADPGRGRRRRDHAARQPGQQRKILLRQGDVDDRPQQERPGQTDGRCKDHQRHHGPDPRPVGDEQPQNAPYRHMPRG